MFCIAAFIVFAVLAIFSASFRPLAASAWHCVARRITFRPCDISFGEEMKAKLVGKFIFTHPRFAKFLSKWIDWLSFAFVALSIWSVVYVANAGLNLWVYDTCDPRSAESCSLSGEACSIGSETLGLRQAFYEGRILEWATGPFTRFAETLSRIPDRVRTWDAAAYVAPTATYYQPLNEGKPYAVEVIDPGCQFCKKLTKHLKAAGVMEAANVSYVLFPIPGSEDGTYKFPNSYLVASYLEAAKLVPLRSAEPNDVPGDWQLLEALFADPAENEQVDLQTRFNIAMDTEEAERTLRQLLRDIGYTAGAVNRIAELAESDEVRDALAAQRTIVQEQIRTVKIPTLLFDGRRYDRVVSVEALERRLR